MHILGTSPKLILGATHRDAIKTRNPPRILQFHSVLLHPIRRRSDSTWNHNVDRALWQTCRAYITQTFQTEKPIIRTAKCRAWVPALVKQDERIIDAEFAAGCWLGVRQAGYGNPAEDVVEKEEWRVGEVGDWDGRRGIRD